MIQAFFRLRFHLKLDEFDRICQQEANNTPLVLAILNGNEEIIGGLLGKHLRGWLRVDMVWVAEELRGMGYGTKLMQRSKEVAKAQGCRSIHLETYSFQAPNFYQRLVYEVFGTLDDYPDGETKYYFKKHLVSQ